MWRPRPRDPFTKEANWVTPFRTRTGLSTTIPDLIVACVVGDGEAETGPLATSWHSNKFLNPLTDGAVLPILHLNGYKIANPCVLARISHEELDQLFLGYGYTPYFVEGSDPEKMHQLMASTLGTCVLEDPQDRIKRLTPAVTALKRPLWPMIVLRTQRMDLPEEIDGKLTEGYWRATRCRWADVATKPAHIKILEKWMRSYKPEELFDKDGRLIPELEGISSEGQSSDERQSPSPMVAFYSSHLRLAGFP